jgi:uncharacterized membrane protein YfhO
MAKKKHKNQAQRAVLTVSAVSDNKYLALSFIFPVAILGTAFALNGVYPFGDRQILANDLSQNYYPFFSGFWHKLRDGTVSPWSWTAGLGHDYVSFLVTFLNPLNLLAIIAPHAWLREVLTLMLLIKIGCAGLFTAMFLRYACKRSNYPVGKKGSEYPLALPVFSSLYALCAFTLGYYYFIEWFDSFALLPLVMLGLLSLMREGKFKLYIVSLALAVLTSFYIGYIICIFVVITFFGLCIAKKPSLPDFLLKLRLVVVYSALAAGLVAILTIPSLFALQSVYNNRVSSPTMSFYNSFFDILGNFIAFTPPTVIEGLPNLYSGMISIMLIGLFFQSKRIALRERAIFLAIFIFLLLCTNIDILYIMMHGFTNPNGCPARFSFLISFVLIVMSYRTFLLAEGMDRRGLLAICISSSLFLLFAVLGPQGKKYIIGSAVLCAFYILLFYFSMTSRTVKTRAYVMASLLITILAELAITSYIGVKTVGTTDRNGYYAGYEQIKSLLNAREKTGVDFYRTESNYIHNANNPYFYYYDGVTFFSSGISPFIMKFMQGLGLNSKRSKSNSNSLYYFETSPLTNAFINMRYIISPSGYTADKDIFWKIVGKTGNALLLENKYWLPLGFMVDKKLADYKYHDEPFLAQNSFFRLATGLEGDLFKIGQFDISNLYNNDNHKQAIKWNYQFPYTGMLYAYCLYNDRVTRKDSELFFLEINLNRAETQPLQLYIVDNTPNIFIVGNIIQNDNITFTLELDNIDNKATLHFGLLDSELFEQGYAKFASQVLQLTKFTNTNIKGRITSLEDGLLYTSIPADKNWSAFVDGVKSEIIKIDNAMISISLNKGYHEIEFRYFNTSFLAGIIVSLVSLALFISLLVLEKRNQ